MTSLLDDEDTVLNNTTINVPDESQLDIEDEIQDWRNLSKLTKSNALPKRGEKDFEPDGTSLQDNQLRESQDAMFDALRGPRGHIIKQNIRAVWIPSVKKALIKKPKGSFLQTCGVVDSSNDCWLNSNEFVYLSERGTIEPWFEKKDLAMDLQSVYASSFLDDDEIDQYHVYSHLKRHGYIVLNHNKNFEEININTTMSGTSWLSKILSPLLQSSLTQWILQKLRKFNLISYSPFHPLHFVTSRYSNYAQIFGSLKLIRFDRVQRLQPDDQDIDITFDVWKPDPSFSKKSPPKPHFQFIVRNVNKHKFPTISQIDSIFQRTSTQKPKLKNPERPLSQLNKLKNGKENVILALVDNGIINFVKLSKSVFGEEKVWYIPTEKSYKLTKRTKK